MNIFINSNTNKYILLFFLLISFLYPAHGQNDITETSPDAYKLSGIKNNHYILKLSNDWELFTIGHSVSATVDLPLLASRDINQVTFSKSFQIADSLRNRNLVIWFPAIQGIVQININNIRISERLNLPTGFKSEIPINILNISGENTVDIIINRSKTVGEGIPNLVNIFKPRQNLGISGDIYLEWLPKVHFKNIKYIYSKSKLSLNYQLKIDENLEQKERLNPKVFCQEVIRDSLGRTVFSRFEYIDLKTMTKKFNRSTEINSPITWSPDSPGFYTLSLTARSGSRLLTFHEEKIGLREISFSNQKMYINDNPVQLKGINYRLDIPVYEPNSGDKPRQDSFTKTLRKDFIEIKNLGFNAIRFPNHTPNSYCFYLADSLGLYLFSEIGLWRVPEAFFRDDNVLQISKKIADDIIQLNDHHPSFIGLGIGNEIPIHMPSVKKYMLILKGYIEQKSPLLLYLIPLNIDMVMQKPITDFYMCNKYDLSLLKEFDEILNTEIYRQGAALILSNVGFSLSNITEEDDGSKIEERQSVRVQKLLETASTSENFGGFFIESYKDWIADSPARLSYQDSSGAHTYPYGLISYSGKKRDLYFKMPQFLKGEYPVSIYDRLSSKRSNFFSISVFLLSIAILFIYRGNYRFRENLKRSMAHPYGFFVDLRDRRIISIINSSIIGLYTNFLVSIIIAAYIYFMRDNLLMEEILSAILVPLKAKFLYLELVKSPLYISVFIWFVFYLLQLTIVILLKIINLLATEKIRFKQYLAVSNWAGAPLFILFPVSMLSYHLMQFQVARPLIILILGLFFFWYNFRLGNGLRVLLTMRTYKIVILLIFLYGGAIFAFVTIYETNYGFLTYLKLLKDAYPLF